ncbi:NAD-dependent epimerase/dehydratase family protein [Frankia nepalensis]|uniref:NAD-dependent epimerase/dehydratase family protein n=1 Tax=Frankia nepalensis TaxID=1836974 RepID=UPI0027DCA9FF|nr:NAD-dependent epimerase/dehydratase family protein [Frankia nepalensis]
MADLLDTPVVLGAGPVGRSVAAALVARGTRPRVVTRSGTTIDGTEPWRADVADPDATRAALGRATAVFQCAQPPYHRWPRNFPAIQRSVVRACEANGAVLVAIENLYGYGPVSVPMTEDLPMRPTTRKGAVRAALWAELLDAHQSGRVRAAAVRASDFFGAGVRDSAYGERFFGPLVSGGKAQVLGSPRARHAITYVPDLAAAAVRVAEDPAAWGRAWHAPTAPGITQLALVEAAARAAGVPPAFVAVKPWQLRLVGAFNSGARETVEMLYEFDHDFVVDSSAFETRFGQPPTPLDRALAETVAWYRQAGA